jgi:hypothetical protein
MLNALKSFSSTGRLETEDLVELSAFARSIEAEFTALGVDTPEWVRNQTKALRREIKARNADAIAARLRELKARREALKTPDEKRTALDTEIAELEKVATATD